MKGELWEEKRNKEQKKKRTPGDSYLTTQQGTEQEVKKGIQHRER